MKLTEFAPPHCSSCYGQDPQVSHVDFEAAYDGPVFTGGVAIGNGEIVNHLPSQIDELIVCEKCLRLAAAMIGMADPGEQGERLVAAEAEADNLRERLEGFGEYTGRLERSLAAKPGRKKIVA